MIRPSPELIAVVRRWLTAFRDRDATTMLNLMLDSDLLRYVGTADGEIWSGDVLRRGIGAHMREIPDYSFRELSLEAFENGATGWALWTGETTYATGGAPVFHRYSFVLALESGAWKVAQVHGSNTVSNVAKMGVEQTALDALVRSAEALGHSAGRSGSATVMFTDIAGSAAIAEALGDRRWSTAVQEHVGLVSALIAAEGGRLVKSLGDGTMSSFTSAGAAMRAARTIQRRLAEVVGEPRLQVRIGMHTGDVVEAGDDFFGTVVNKAARIASLARPGEIRVSEATRIMVGGAAEFAFSDPARLALKGLEGEHVTYRLEPDQ